MNNKIILIAGAIFILALFTLNNFFGDVAEHGQTQSISKSINQLKSDNVLSKIGLKRNSEELSDIAKIQDMVNKLESYEDIEITHADVEDKEKRITEIYQMDQKKMHLYLEEIKDNQKIIKKWKREHGVKISALENTNPEFALTLSTILNKPIEEAVEANRAELGFSSHEWYFIKTIATSGDLQKLMRQGKLSDAYVNIDNLAVVYSNNPQVVYRNDGQVDGLPKAEENLEDSVNEEDEKID